MKLLYSLVLLISVALLLESIECKNNSSNGNAKGNGNGNGKGKGPSRRGKNLQP